MIKIDSLELYKSSNLLSLDSATSLIKKLKSEGKTVGLCHGGFDLTHPGHFKHFECAKKLCDILLVSITSDKYVAERKGSGRPIYTDKLRAYAVANSRFVDYVLITDFAKGIEVINLLQPSFYIKGADFINKTTPGIMAEREMIKSVGGEIKYTNEPPMSTTKIIDYIKNELEIKQLLLIVDRDGTLIKNNDFPGKNDSWKEELELNEPVVSFISYLQTKYKTTKIVVSNQAGVARKFFDCKRVENVNSHLDLELMIKGIKIDNWQYCPHVDSKYASTHPELEFDKDYISEITKRKPSTDMVMDGLKMLNKCLNDFNQVLVLGDRSEDAELAKNLNANFFDVNSKSYKELISSASLIF